MSSHYPPYVKTLMKTSGIVHLLFLAMTLTYGMVRYNVVLKNERPRRRFYKAGKFDSFLQVRDERHREIIRPLLDSQPADVSYHLFKPFVSKPLN